MTIEVGAPGEDGGPWLLGWVPRVDSRWVAPEWLGIDAALERMASTGGVRVCWAGAVRHGKTSALRAWCAGRLRRAPEKRLVYMTYSVQRAGEIGKDIRDDCRRMGVKVEAARDTILNWRTPEGGGVSCMSAQQSKLGADVDDLIVDDPIESQAEADKLEVRNAVDETIAFYTSRLNRGGSVALVMSRFHPDDPIGRRLQRTAEQWEYIHRPAILDEGLETERALAPQMRTLEELRAIRAAYREIDPNERIWWSQWMNDPRALSGDLFHGPTHYTELPTWSYRTVMGCDFAFSQNDGSDYFALVVARLYGRRMFLMEVTRDRLVPTVIESHLRSAQLRWGRCPIFSYVSGPEVGLVKLLTERGYPVSGIPARFNKLVRAERTVARWNQGDILVPEQRAEPWVAGFLSRLAQFRGHEHDPDDEVDALVSAHDGIFGMPAAAPRTVGQPRI